MFNLSGSIDHCHRPQAMPDKGDAPSIDLGVLAQKLHGSNDIPGFIPIKLALAPPMTTEIEAKGGNTPAGDLLGTGPHRAMVGAQAVAQNRSRERCLALGQNEFTM